MTEISASIRLRPTRIGFLVQPNDLASVRKIMRACACLWGGIYNPIIPVFRTPPGEWRSEPHERVKGFAVAKGYVRFYEPDVFVESRIGLLEVAGLGALRKETAYKRQIISLSKFLEPQDSRDWSDPAFGLNMIDVLRHLYETEQRFQMRDERLAVQIKPERGNCLVESVFGAYPSQKDTQYIEKGYQDVFAPQELKADPESWNIVFRKAAQTPLGITRFGIERQRYWHHDPVIFIFDPTKPTDLIDCWNMRLEPCPILPVPIDWFESLADDIREIVRTEHRPIRGNPSGLMHYATLEFGRSIAKERADGLVEGWRADLPNRAFGVKHWRTPVWVEHKEDRIHWDKRMEVTAEERSTTLSIKEEPELTANFETLTPEFASRFGRHAHRWANVLRVSEFGSEKIGTVIPYNTFDRSWPRVEIGGDEIVVGSEGWVFGQKYKNWTTRLTLLTKEDTIIGALKNMGMDAKLSDPGHIARQMLEHLGGMWGIGLLADLETLQLLNKMAGGVRRKSNDSDEIEETFARRSAPVKDWSDLVSRRKEKKSLPKIELADFTKRNVLQLGLESDCPHCHVTNWHSLTTVDYNLVCERCLNDYDFPQAQLRNRNRNWAYRVVGPFSVPDYGRGAYSTLLTLRVLDSFGVSSDKAMTFSTAMNLEFDGKEYEVDFVALRKNESGASYSSPELVLGETKSLGHRSTIKSEDLSKLKAIGRKLPGSVIVISTLRDHFTAEEKEILVPFVNWGRRTDEYGQSTNPVILLTAHELFMDYMISATWKKLGQPYDAYTDYEHTRNLQKFAEANQKIYLDLPSVYEWREAEWKKRAARKKSGSKTTP